MPFPAQLTITLRFQSVGSLAGGLIGTFAIDYARLVLLFGLCMMPGSIVAIPRRVLTARVSRAVYSAIANISKSVRCQRTKLSSAIR